MEERKEHILTANLAGSDAALSALLEKRLAHIGDLAELLCDEAGEEEIFFRDEAFAARYRALTCRPPVPTAPVNRERVAVWEKGLSAVERALLLCRLCDLLGIRGLRGMGTFFDDPSDDGSETVSYVRSSYADTAYRALAAEMADPKVLYAHEFSEACENVYYGRSAFCLLPVENTVDGRLAGFRSLMIKYGLKTVRVVRVKDDSLDGSTLFALLKRGVTVPDTEKPCFLEIRVKTEDLPVLLASGEACGMKAVEMTRVPNRRHHYDIVFAIGPEGVCGFLSLLHLEYPGFLPTGVFGESTIGKEEHDL